MNQALLKEIVSHVMAHFGVIPSAFVDHKRTNSLMDPSYLVSEKIVFEEEGQQYQGKIWGCQLSVSQTEVKVLLGECTTDPEFPEFALVLQSKDAPAYGLYLCYNEVSNHPEDSEPDLSVSLNGKDWMDCNTFLQATFLAATEQVRELLLPWKKCVEYKEMHAALLSFMNYHAGKIGE
jgi:hypothetical protein